MLPEEELKKIVDLFDEVTDLMNRVMEIVLRIEEINVEPYRIYIIPGVLYDITTGEVIDGMFEDDKKIIVGMLGTVPGMVARYVISKKLGLRLAAHSYEFGEHLNILSYYAYLNLLPGDFKNPMIFFELVITCLLKVLAHERAKDLEKRITNIYREIVYKYDPILSPEDRRRIVKMYYERHKRIFEEVLEGRYLLLPSDRIY